MPRTPHQLRYAVADAAGTVALVIETTVYSYDGEDPAAVVETVTTSLEDQLRSRGRPWSAIPAGTPTPQRGDKLPRSAGGSKPADSPGQAGR